MRHSFLVHDARDTVGVAIENVAANREAVAAFLTGARRISVKVLDDVPLGHKVALRDLDVGAEVLKYGLPIGHTTQRVRAGEYVHTHNLRSARW